MIEIPKIIGLPPIREDLDSEYSKNIFDFSFPVMTIKPCKAVIDAGLSLFNPEFDQSYFDNLKKLGISIPSEIEINQQIKVAFIPETLPSENFQNEYGESFLNQMADVASGAISDVLQITGQKTIGQAIGTVEEVMQNMGGITGTVGKMFQQGTDMLRDYADNLPQGAVNTINSLASGHRIDFPKVWKNSNFNTNYSFLIKLYNPKPGDADSIDYHIAGPLAALLCLGLPRSQDGETYMWPYIHIIDCPGLFTIPAAYIQNISVNKGGDGNQIGLNQGLGLVDVRIDIGSLFDNMIIEDNGKTNSIGRPTIKKYIENIRKPRKINIIDGIQNFTDTNYLYQNNSSPLQNEIKFNELERIDAEKKNIFDALNDSQPNIN